MLRILVFALLLLTPAFALAQDDPGPPPSMMEAPRLAPPANTELQVRMNALETQLRNVTGQLERTQFQNTQMQQVIQRMNADVDGRFQMLERRVGTVEARPIAAPPQPVPVAAPPVAPAAPPAAAPAAAPAATPPVAPEPEEQTSAPPSKDTVLGTLSKTGEKPGDAQTLYDQAFQAMRQARYDEAETKFRDFLKNHSKHRLAENAKYWLGETYYVRNKFQEAAVTFGEGFQQFPTGNKAPDNLLKLSMALGSMNKKQDACTTLAELKKRYPNASAIIRNRAEQEKKTLACT